MNEFKTNFWIHKPYFWFKFTSEITGVFQIFKAWVNALTFNEAEIVTKYPFHWVDFVNECNRESNNVKKQVLGISADFWPLVQPLGLKIRIKMFFEHYLTVGAFNLLSISFRNSN